MNHRFHVEALRELREAIEYYLEISPEVVADFTLEISRLVREACDHPHVFRQFDPPARRHFSTRFPYGIIYLVEPDGIWIIAVMPLKREPGYWKQRLTQP